MAEANNNTTTAQESTQSATNAQSPEEAKSFAERMLTMERPNRDTRVKTEDVTGTTGMTFRDFNLADSVQFGIFEMGFELPSPIQEQAIPKIMQGQNIIAKAKNGTGKTAAYGIPLVEKIDTSLNKI